MAKGQDTSTLFPEANVKRLYLNCCHLFTVDDLQEHKRTIRSDDPETIRLL